MKHMKNTFKSNILPMHRHFIGKQIIKTTVGDESTNTYGTSERPLYGSAGERIAQRADLAKSTTSTRAIYPGSGRTDA